jgi:hypothetical protein
VGRRLGLKLGGIDDEGRYDPVGSDDGANDLDGCVEIDGKSDGDMDGVVDGFSTASKSIEDNADDSPDSDFTSSRNTPEDKVSSMITDASDDVSKQSVLLYS